MQIPTTRREREVWQACDELWAQGLAFQQITGEVIQERLVELGYKKGSPRETYRYRATWKDARGIKSSTSHQNNLSVLSDPISRAVNLVREEIQTEAEQKIKVIQEEADAKWTEAQIQLTHLQAELQTCHQQLSHLNEINLKLSKENDTLQNNLTKTQQKLILSEQQIAAQERLVNTIKQEAQQTQEQLKQTQQSEISRLLTQLKHQQMASREELTELKRLLEAERGTWNYEREQLKLTNQKQESDLQQAQTSECRLTEINHDLKNELNNQRKINQELQGEAQSLAQKIIQLENSLNDEKSKNRYLEGSFCDKISHVELLQQTIVQHQKTIQLLEEKIEFLKENQNNKVARKKRQLSSA